MGAWQLGSNYGRFGLIMLLVSLGCSDARQQWTGVGDFGVQRKSSGDSAQGAIVAARDADAGTRNSGTTTVDAETALKEALAQAKANDKRVFVHFGFAGCYPCRVLDAFLRRNPDLLTSDYVVLKIDVEKMPKGMAVRKRLRNTQDAGFPLIVVLSSDGERLSSQAGFGLAADGPDKFMRLIKETSDDLSHWKSQAIVEALREDARRYSVPRRAPDQESSELTRAIARAWKQRESRVQSLRCEWEGTFVSGERSQVLYDHDWEPFAFPPKDVELCQKWSLIFAGADRMRYQVEGKQLVSAIHSFEERHYISVMNDKDIKAYYGGDETGRKRFAPIGFIRSEPLDLGTLPLRPLMLLFRSSLIAEQVDITKFALKDFVVINGRECAQLDRYCRAGSIQRIYVDITRDYVPLRIAHLTVDRTTENPPECTTEIDISYADHPDHGWTPSGWQQSLRKPGGRVIQGANVKITSLELNLQVSEAAFDFEFPAGTIVSTLEDEMYLVRKDGSKRYVTSAELEDRVPYRTLLSTETGEAVSADSNRKGI